MKKTMGGHLVRGYIMLIRCSRKRVLAVIAGFVFTLIFSAGAFAQREEIDLTASTWKIWMDTSAAWESDTLYLPEDITDIDTLPHNSPTGGWSSMYSSEGTSCTIPAVVEEFFGGGVNTWTYHGVSWLWADVDIPSSWAGKTVRLQFEKTRMRAEVYIDEDLAGYDLVAETPWQTDVSGYLTDGAANKLAVRVTNPGGQKGWSDYPFVDWGSYQFPASHDFGGIGGKVILVCTDNTYIDNVFIKNMLPVGGRNIDVITTIENKQAQKNVTLSVEIYPYPSGSAVYSNSWSEQANADTTTEITKSITVPSADLWEIDSPNLYYCEVSITGSGVDDSLTERFGFRVFEVKEVSGKDNLYFNGERIRHRSAIDWGLYALTGFYANHEMAERSVQSAKDIGHNGINCHRRIGETLVFKYADELGLYMYEEPASMHIDQGYNVPPDTFAGDILEHKVKRMAVRERNHPSLIWYNLSNEDNGWNDLRQRSMDYLRDLDGTRMITNTSAWEDFINHIRPYESSIRTDYDDHHTVGSSSRFQESILRSHNTTVDSRVKYWGEVGCYTGPSNWYKVAEMDIGRIGNDRNIYQPMHDKILAYYNTNHLNLTGSGSIASPGDVSTQAGRGLMYTDGRFGQAIMRSNSEDGYAINGWSSGPQATGSADGNGYFDHDSAICDEARNVKGPPSDFAYWTRELQIAILRQNGKYFDVGEDAEFDVHLINEGHLAAGDYTLKIRVIDGAGDYTAYTNDQVVHVDGGDVYAQEFINALMITTQAGWHGGYITIEGKLYDGATLKAEGKEQILLRNRSSYLGDITAYTGAANNWLAAKTAVQDTGASISDFSTGLGPLDYIVAGAPSVQTSWHINSGGSAIDGLLPDTGYSGGIEYSIGSSVSNNYGYPNAMKSCRYDGFNYQLAVLDGDYTVKLYFVEVYWQGPNIREFHVDIEGSRVLTDFDIYEETGGRYIGIEKVFTNVTVSDGVLNIDFINTTLNFACVNVIVVDYEGTPPPTPIDGIDDMLDRVYNDGTLLITKFDAEWAGELYGRGILSEEVTGWGGAQTGFWNGNGWGYLDYFIGDQAVPSGSTIGTNSWEVTGDPYGFWPFESPYSQTAYGAYFARTEKLYVLIGQINYGSGYILLVPTYPVGVDNAFTDMLFYNLISMGCAGLDIPYPACDLNHDYFVNGLDLSVFAFNWLQTGCGPSTWCGGADLNESTEVNMVDFSKFTQCWAP